MLNKSLDSCNLELLDTSDLKKKTKEFRKLSAKDWYDFKAKFKTGGQFFNREKNRYRDNLPNDSTRVKLEDLTNNYINANFIKYGKETYICTQAPIENTFRDFWKMIWDQETFLIVMLTPLKENGIIKSHKYWPEKNAVKFIYSNHETVNKDNIKIQISPLLVKNTEKLVLRLFNIKYKNSDFEKTREVFHLHYKSWNDFKIPISPKSIDELLNLIKFYKNYGNMKYNLKGPIVLHCSAGLGRTGTLIACDLVKKSKNISIKDLVKLLKSQRNGLVQTLDQYNFIYEFNEFINA